MDREEIIKHFEEEFSFLGSEFSIIDTRLAEAGTEYDNDSEKKYIHHPGVYVFWSKGKVWKVGRSFYNSRKRALEHLSAGTAKDGYELNSLEQDKEARILLFNLKDREKFHWAAALEVYFEKKLEPLIKSDRQG